MSKVASSTLGYRTVIEVGIATVEGAAEKDDKGANWYDLLVKDSGRFGWFTKGAQVMGIGEMRQRRASAEKIYLYLAIRMFVGWLQPLTWTLPRGRWLRLAPRPPEKRSLVATRRRENGLAWSAMPRCDLSTSFRAGTKAESSGEVDRMYPVVRELGGVSGDLGCTTRVITRQYFERTSEISLLALRDISNMLALQGIIAEADRQQVSSRQHIMQVDEK